MMMDFFPTTARTSRAVVILCLSLVIPLSSAALDAHAQPAAAASAATVARNVPASKPQVTSKPLWAELTPAQQQALAPLAPEWDRLDSFRKKKWLAIGNKYATMKPDEQQRVQERMRDWVKLTPEQRRIARENYARARKLDRNQKSAHWEEYQQLSEEQKKKLAASAASRKRVATLPSPSSQRKNAKTIPPIKSAPKPVLEQSVTPKAAAKSPIQPSAQPEKQ
ncbi:MAG TPA: DUF3106 domain-containing protein [Noviherbaspirillum sp.]|uniref:DUF3106 domain-containing protein n=1 Tax=Noviherbaspirillum sp. TaxID=1926288 RepID=UPI002B487DA7|nr:DUF3106 domain-containing protein [Noviherbaspirillum sp.]HJV85675.1 DUF3106 domain-containing protein [Noviherbaspirillum sp.]